MKHTTLWDAFPVLNQLPSYESTGSAASLSSNQVMGQLLELLKHPDHEFKVIHVAGTNGKGTTVHKLACALKAEGFRCGEFLSPPVQSLRDCILINQQWISHQDLEGHFSRVIALATSSQPPLPLSRFDALLAAALLAFREQRVEVAVIECGLGGLDDSTNVLRKDLAVITSIGLDHQAVLGHSLKEVVRHKLGILRQGVPAIIAAQSSEAQREIRLQSGDLTEHMHWVDSSQIDSSQAEALAPDFHLPALELQAEQAVLLALQKLFEQSDWRCNSASSDSPLERRQTWIRAMRQCHLPGRLQRLKQVKFHHFQPMLEQLILDAAHNAQAVSSLHKQLIAWQLESFHLVLAFNQDKCTPDLAEALKPLIQSANSLILTQFASSRCMPVQALNTYLALETFAKPHYTTGSVEQALQRLTCLPAGPVVVMGSFQLAASVLDHIESSLPFKQPA